MATLAIDKPRWQQLGDFNDFAVIAADIIYEGAAVGIATATGLARPLAATDRFAGFCAAKCDNSAGIASALRVKVLARGRVQLSVAAAVITDVGLAVYATDDDTFTMVSAGGIFIGFANRFVSAGVLIVSFDALTMHV